MEPREELCDPVGSSTYPQCQFRLKIILAKSNELTEIPLALLVHTFPALERSESNSFGVTPYLL